KTAQDIDLWVRVALNHSVSFDATITMRYKHYVKNSLSENEYNIIRYNLINHYFNLEKTNASLKYYLDNNRYALAIRSKIHDPKWVYEQVKKDIEKSNLNKKQTLLLNLPVFLLKSMKWLHGYLIKREIYLTSYT